MDYCTHLSQGGGTIRRKTVTRNGKEYTYWEARITTGRDPGTGKQIQRSFRGKTQKEVREKMQAVAVAVNDGTYTAPQRMTAVRMATVKGGDMEYFISVALFTGMRMSEILGLTWDAINFDTDTISINKQFAMTQHRKDGIFITPKSGKPRTITAAPLHTVER